MDNKKLFNELHENCQYLNLLYVEDDIELSRNTVHFLEPFFDTIYVAENGQEGLDKYKAHSIDIVLTDIIMPVMDGKEMSQKIKEINPKQSIIVMSAIGDSDHLMALIEIGIDKFIQKPINITRFTNSLITTATNINNAKKIDKLNQEMKDDLHVSKQKLDYQAEHDSLTGFPNRNLFFDRLNQAIKKAAPLKQKIAVILVDVDRFKEINDSFGHEFGDRILSRLGNRIELQIGKLDTIARFSGDEFVILIDSIDSVNHIADVMQNITDSISKEFNLEGQQLHLTISAGISIYPDDALNAETLIRNADSALYRAKDKGRNNYQFYTKNMTKEILYQMTLVKDLHNAIENDEFILHYQPQINAKTNTLIGMEALIRWVHPNKGFIPPTDFIPIAEDCGLINKIGELVFSKALSQIVAWYTKGLKPGVIAINLSALELEQDNFAELIAKRLSDFGCKAEWVELEITEGYMMKHPDVAINILHDIKALGIQLAIDDFGTGYSSLSYLKKLPIDKLKIDKSFVSDVVENKNDKAIVESIIYLANTMEFDIIAEGVETLEQQTLLIEKGCNNIQGYYNAKPMPAAEMENFILDFEKKNK